MSVGANSSMAEERGRGNLSGRRFPADDLTGSMSGPVLPVDGQWAACGGACEGRSA